MNTLQVSKKLLVYSFIENVPIVFEFINYRLTKRVKNIMTKNQNIIINRELLTLAPQPPIPNDLKYLKYVFKKIDL